jgi:uncharacterized protein YjbI with pentapeptide repeats
MKWLKNRFYEYAFNYVLDSHRNWQRSGGKFGKALEFSGEDLTGVKFNASGFTRASFLGCRFVEARFDRSSFRDANFSSSTFDTTRLDGSHIRNCSVKDVNWIGTFKKKQAQEIAETGAPDLRSMAIVSGPSGPELVMKEE